MRTSRPKWLDEKSSTRKRSKKQESRIAKELSGKTTINSGATLGQNDVVTDWGEVEAKTTSHNSYSLKTKDWEKLQEKSPVNKIPVMVIDFEQADISLAVISMDDLKWLVKAANSLSKRLHDAL